MVADKPRRTPSRRALIIGAAGVAGVAAAGVVFGEWAGPSLGLFGGDASPSEDASTSPGDEVVADDLVEGVELVDSGFSRQPPRAGRDTPLLGVGARLRNTTDAALWVSAVYIPVDAEGRALQDGDGTGRASFGYGEIPVPPSTELDSVGIGLLEETALPTERIGGVAVQLHRLDFEAKYRSGARIVPATPSSLDHHSGDGPGVDLVTFEADNPGPEVRHADYMVHFRDADGGTIGGWYADRARWNGLEKRLPEGETEVYPTGTSSHTLPVWLPPGLTPRHVDMYLWERP
ncbi:hypothetical protein LX16_3439 [Stackebrandtia albiflava]|uniref:Uncharacterized protein n=1 Tax=Stackebrandtia albiflava TaxID=406432 RepID=A0A562V4D5_9ACTN|nr:hypothetical protein [Stackebrandtia albiflava]TWJ12677.1 hypothetical protein LX16_3439 [Stackebrandtia albiflava]